MGRHARQAFISAVLILPAGWVLAGAADQPATPSDARNDTGASTLLYVSDYISFVGEDAQGHVAFALDNNRGRDGDAYQAEHFVVLHDERQGWINVLGNGRYDNPKHELWTIPDSPAFTFQGTPATGITVASRADRLTLRVEPIPAAVERAHQGARYRMGGAPAVLEWAGRTLKGRVIYEYVFMPEFNRLTRVYWGLWKEYQGLYLAIGGQGDLYVHSQQSELIVPLVGRLLGFTVLNGHVETLEELALSVLDRTMALGFYRWPTRWQVEWTGREGPVSATLTLSDRKSFGNWVFGGFSMGIVKGDAMLNGRKQAIYGLAELLI
jgi:hypothetical protein